MPFINQRHIASSVRALADRAYRKQLRAALSNPVLTQEQRLDLRSRLHQVGQPRVYAKQEAPKPTLASLMNLRRPELVQMARDARVSHTGTKAVLAERLLKI